MFLHVIEARYLREHVLWVLFNTGVAGEVDLASEMNGPVFGPLNALENFKAFRIDPELKTIVWENGADLAPEFLHDLLRITV